MSVHLPPGATHGPVRPVPDVRLPDLIVARALARPSSVAVRQGDDELGYGDLLATARLVAGQLAALGVGPGDRVAVTGERRPALIGALFGVLLCGAAYVPLDPTLPAGRRAVIATDAGIRALVTTGPGDDAVVGEPEVTPIGPATSTGPTGPGAPTRCPAGADDAAYVMFTSGSTGRPKGVVVPHRALTAFTTTLVDLAGLDADTVAIGFASIGFDVSVIDLWVPLAAGGSVALVPTVDRTDPARLQRFLGAHGVTFGALPPALLPLLDPAALPALRLLMTGTEAPGPEQVARWAGPGRRFLNCYGPTEATVQVTWFEATGAWDEPVPIGRPMPNHRVHVVDPAGRQVGVGVPGELLVGGVGLATGYLNDPVSTAERFVPDPFGPADPDPRLYRTGDLAAWRPDGTLMFLGRLDRQVKVRGQRVETAEVEAVLRAHPDVTHAVVDAVAGPAGTELVAFVAGAGPDVDALRTHLAGTLPAVMVPARIVVVDALPLGPTGKVDLDRLRELLRTVDAPPAVAHRPPVSATERAVAAAWCEVLGVGPAGLDDDFVAAGGHSVTAMRLVALLRARLERDLSVEHVLGGRTVAALAAAADTAGPASGPLRRGRPPALSAAQRRLWFLDRYAPGAGAAYNISFADRLRGPLDIAALRTALGAVAARQEVLRWRMPDADGVPRAVLDPPGEVALPVADVAPDTLDERLEALAREPFDLAGDRLWRARLYRLGPADHVLAVVAHHAVFDGWSQALFADDLAAAYAAAVRAGPTGTVHLPPLPAGYGDYVAWREQREATRGATDLAWWVTHLTGAPSTVDIPTDRPRPAEQTYRGAQVATTLDPDRTAAVDTLARSLGTTPSAVLLAAFTVVLAGATGSRDMVVGSPTVDRRHPDFEPMVGFCIEITPLRLRPTDDAAFADLVRATGDELVAALARPEAPLDRIVEAFGLGGRLDRAPLVQVLFNMFNYAARPLALTGLDARPVPVPAAGSPFDLTVYGEHGDGRLRVEIVYNPDLFTVDRMVTMLDRLRSVLADGVAHPNRTVRELGAGPPVPYDGPLLRPARPGHRGSGEPPASDTERAVAAVWCAALGTAAVGVTDSFFEVGGSSLAAVTVQHRLNRRLGTTLSVVDVFRYPTVRALAARIDATRPSGAAGTGAGAPNGSAPDDGLDRAAQRGAARRDRAAHRRGRRTG